MTESKRRQFNLSIALHKAIRKSIKRQFEQHVQDFQHDPIQHEDPQEWTPDWDIVDQDVCEDPEYLQARQQYQQRHGRLRLDEVKREVFEETDIDSDEVAKKFRDYDNAMRKVG